MLPSGSLRVQQADRLQRDDAGQRELHHAGVLMLRLVVEQEAAALHRIGFDRQTDAVRRQEADVEIGEVQIRFRLIVGEIERELEADAVDAREHGTDLRTERQPGIDQHLRRRRRSCRDRC